MTRTQVEIEGGMVFWLDVREGVLKTGQRVTIKEHGTRLITMVCVSLPEEALKALPHRLGTALRIEETS